jgi:hypothetical protein
MFSLFHSVLPQTVLEPHEVLALNEFYPFIHIHRYAPTLRPHSFKRDWRAGEERHHHLSSRGQAEGYHLYRPV